MPKTPDKFTLAFAARLRTLRTAAGISQSELARQIGRKPPDVCAFEAARRGPTFATACKIADVLGINVGDLR